jgi:hypothetical protein
MKTVSVCVHGPILYARLPVLITVRTVPYRHVYRNVRTNCPYVLSKLLSKLFWIEFCFEKVFDHFVIRNSFEHFGNV